MLSSIAKRADRWRSLEQILQGLLDSIESHDLTIGRFMDLSHTLGCETVLPPSKLALAQRKLTCRTPLRDAIFSLQVARRD